MNEYLPLLNNVRQLASKYGEALQPSATKAQVVELTRKSSAELAYNVPVQYVEFLMTVNGLDWNGYSIYATSFLPLTGVGDRLITGFVERNKQYHEAAVNRPFIAFGETGGAAYVFDKRSGKFAEVDHPSLDVIGTYPTFNDLLCRILSQALM